LEGTPRTRANATIMTRHPLSNNHSYILLSINPPCADALKLRKAMQDGLMETFGITASGTYLDILWIAESGSEVVIRLAEKSVHLTFFFSRR
jgi:hypothetical protein